MQVGFMLGTVEAFRELTWQFRKPVVAGDTLHIEAKTASKKAIRGYKGGLVSLDISLINQKGEAVHRGTWTLLVKGKPEAAAATKPMTIHKLTLPTHMPVGPVNVYLVEGDLLTLIDTGPRSDETFRVLEQEVAARGFSLSDLKRIVITHTHPDHFGLVRRLVDLSGAEIWTHPYNAGWFNAPGRDGRAARRVYAPGVPAGGCAGCHRAGHGTGRKRFGRMFEAAPASHWLQEGDTFELGGLPWQVLHTPGHASGHISFYEPRSRQMIAGDHLIKHISSNPMLEGPRIDGQPRDMALVQYMESMRRVAQMDVSVAYSGHGDEITAHRELIEERLVFHAARVEHIYNLVAERQRTAYELMRELFPRLTDFEIYLGLSEIIGHLDILQLQGRILWRAYSAVYTEPQASRTTLLQAW